MRRRVLEKLILTEISGVDLPCQEGARVAIMKRDYSGDRTVLLQKRIDALKMSLTKFDPDKHPHDARGRWATVSSAAGRAIRATGRALRATGSAVWAGYRALPLEMQIATAAGAAQLVHQGVQYARGTPEQRAQIRTAIPAKAMAGVKAHVARTTAMASAGARADSLAQTAFASGAAGLASVAGIPFVITRDMKQQLADKGYKFSDIARMTPAQAHVILSKSLLQARLGKLNRLLSPAGGLPVTHQIRS